MCVCAVREWVRCYGVGKCVSNSARISLSNANMNANANATDSNGAEIFSLRIVSIDNYMRAPVLGLDTCYSEFRAEAVKQVSKKEANFVICHFFHFQFFPLSCVSIDLFLHKNQQQQQSNTKFRSQWFAYSAPIPMAQKRVRTSMVSFRICMCHMLAVNRQMT